MDDESVNPPQQAEAWTVRRLSTVAVIAITAPVVLYGVFVLMSWRQDPHLGGDIALLEMSTRSASDGDAYLGPYSRFRWNHPGPAVFYWFAPFYYASGQAVGGLGVAAVASVVVSLTVSAVCAVRHDRLVGAVVIVISGSWFHVAAGTDWYDNMWNPVMVIAPVVLAGFAAAACYAGSQRWLPIATVAVSFGVQTHIGTVPVLASFGALAMVAAVVGFRARPHDWVPAIGASAVVALVMWSLPVYEQVTRSPGNLTQLLETDSATSGEYRSLGDVLDVVVGQLTLGDTHLVSDALVDQAGLPAAGWFRMIWLAALVAAVGAVSWRAARAGNRFRSGLGVASIAASLALVVGLLGVSGELKGYLTLTATSVGLLLNFVLVSGVLREVAALLARSGAADGAELRLGRMTVPVALGVAVMATSLVLIGDSPSQVVADRLGVAGVDDAVDELFGADVDLGAARFDIVDNDGWPIVAAIADEFERRGGSASTSEPSLYLFNDDRTPTGCETLIVTATTTEPPATSASGSTVVEIAGVWLAPSTVDVTDRCER